MKRRVPLTAKVIRGLQTAFYLGVADMDAAETDYTSDAFDDLAAADRWLRSAIAHTAGPLDREHYRQKPVARCRICRVRRANRDGRCTFCTSFEKVEDG